MPNGNYVNSELEFEQGIARMPDRTLGEIQKGTDIGKSDAHKYMWCACKKCGVRRWVRLNHGKPEGECCQLCGRALHRFSKEEQLQNSKDGRPYWFSRRLTNWGYSIIKVSPKDRFYSMADRNGCIKEHRYVVAESLNRTLLAKEHVHHKNGIKTDNRLGNLELISPANHTLYNTICSHCELRKEIRLLRWQLKQFMKQSQGVLIPAEVEDDEQ